MLASMQQGSIPPFPAEIISESPHFALMSALELGALMALSLAYWAAQARPLPSDDAALSVLAKCHTRRWYDVRAKVMEAWIEVQPRLASVYATKAQRISEARAYALANISLAHEVQRGTRAKRQREVKLKDQSDSVVALVPQTAQFCTESRGNGADSAPKRTIRAQKGALLADAG